MIVIVPVTPAGLSTFVAGPVEMATTSLISESVSWLTVVRRSTPVPPTGIVTPPAALTQAVPLKYSMPLPVSVPTVPAPLPPPAVPLASDGVNVIGDVAGRLSDTSTTALYEASFTTTLEIDIVGLSMTVTVPLTPAAVTAAPPVPNESELVRIA